MKKIPTLFVRDPETHFVTNELTEGCGWVINGEGWATRKYDGTCVAQTEEGFWYARREVKKGKEWPHGFVKIETDENTGKTVGWEPIEQSSFFKFWIEAFEYADAFGGPLGLRLPFGTYELIGPKINGNPEKRETHRLVRHENAEIYADAPRTFEELKVFLPRIYEIEGAEGLVWHHPDGRMAKLKAKDFPR